MLSFKKPLAAAIKPTPTDNFHTSHAIFFHKLLLPQELHVLHHLTALTRRSVAPVEKFVLSITAGNVDPRGTTFTPNYVQKGHFKRYKKKAATLPRL